MLTGIEVGETFRLLLSRGWTSALCNYSNYQYSKLQETSGHSTNEDNVRRIREPMNKINNLPEEFLQLLMRGATMAWEAGEIRWEWLYMKISEQINLSLLQVVAIR